MADPPVTLEFYDELLDRYASHFRVIIFEIPAMGFTVPRFGLDFTFPSINDSIIEFLECVVGPSAILAFSCVAGLGAVDIANRRPDLVSRLVLIQTPSWAEEIQWKKTRDPKKILAKPFIGQIVMNFLKKNRAPAWFSLVLGNKDYYQPFSAMAQQTIAEGAGWALASAFQRYLPDDGPDLPLIKQPFLCLWGDLDGSHLQTDKQSSLSFGPKGNIVRYHDLGHFPELESVDRIYGDISHFITGG